MMNILNNAKDVLVENNIEDKCIFIDMYENFRNKSGNIETFDFKKEETEKEIFMPNKMQSELLEKLKLTREFGNKKGLIVAATGTGKTYLAAMDILKMKPKSFLFIVFIVFDKS